MYSNDLKCEILQKEDYLPLDVALVVVKSSQSFSNFSYDLRHFTCAQINHLDVGSAIGEGLKEAFIKEVNKQLLYKYTS